MSQGGSSRATTARPLREFARHKLAGGLLLLGATVVALAWASSPWHAGYQRILEGHVVVGTSWFNVDKPVLLWVNDALMGVFFFLVGLEIKRELVAGELRTPKRALLPLAAAAGGMVVPALLYLALNPTPPSSRGFGVPMATDIAFALGVLALAGDKVPLGLKVFLTAVAIVDDIGSIVVIAFFYSEGLSLATLSLGGALLALSLVCNRLGARSAVLYFALGSLVWLAFLKSGVHATLAAVLMAFTIPARAKTDAGSFAARMEELVALWRTVPGDETPLLTAEQHEVAEQMALAVEEATAPLQRLEHALAPVATFLVLPVFALANAGVRLASDGAGAAAPWGIALGIAAGLTLGKPIGITLASLGAVRLGIAELPRGVGWRHVVGAGFVGGVGFTMSLFVSSLAFVDAASLAMAKGAILGASTVSGLVGLAILMRAPARDTVA